MTAEEFKDLIKPITEFIGPRPLDSRLEKELNARFPASGETFLAISRACSAGIQAGWMCKHEAGGIRYGRVIKPSPDTHSFSVDVVDMANIKGPHHTHPNGEVDLVMPLSPEAKFDDRGAGWVVYSPGSAHHPTVSSGRALVLYLLPDGAIDFTRS